MFIDKGSGKKIRSDKYPAYNGRRGGGKYIEIAISLVAFFFLLFLLVFVYSNVAAPPQKPADGEDKKSGESLPEKSPAVGNSASFLPSLEDVPTDYEERIYDLSNLEIEKIAFGDFYEEEKVKTVFDVSTYELPINIKADVLNYYVISREINLDPYLEQLSENGFVLTEGIFRNERDFFTVYNKIEEEDIPAVFTADFIYYFYQNTLRQVYKKIEKDLFYDNVWKIYKTLYDEARKDYLTDYAANRLSNDPALEAKRQVAGYMAVMLEILKPKNNQVSKNANLANENNFSPQDAEKYNYLLIDAIKDDVTEETSRVFSSGGTAKSKIFRRRLNYRDFKVPAEYRGNAKLNNFYLASKWMNVLFPLYYKSEACPDCLLDQEDWLINTASALMIAEKMYNNQNIQNDWAVIYKILSFFKGLRQDLTYIDYYENYLEVADGRSIDEVFSRDNQQISKDIRDLQNSLSGIKFYDLEGALTREKEENLSKIGMRLLQEDYSPNEFIFDYLSGREYELEKGSRGNLFTACDPKRGRIYRCRSTGKDVIDLVYDFNDPGYASNRQFEGFESNFGTLESMLEDFTVFSWHNNIYWQNLYTVSRYLHEDYPGMYAYQRNKDNWDERIIESSMAALVNPLLDHEEVVVHQYVSDSELGYRSECNKFNYIEINFNLLAQLEANISTLESAFDALDISRKSNIVVEDLTILKEFLSKIKAIMQRQADSGFLSEEDCGFISEFTKKYKVERNSSPNQLRIKGDGAITRQILENPRIMITVKKIGEDLVIAMGPVFDYNEGK